MLNIADHKQLQLEVHVARMNILLLFHAVPHPKYSPKKYFLLFAVRFLITKKSNCAELTSEYVRAYMKIHKKGESANTESYKV